MTDNASNERGADSRADAWAALSLMAIVIVAAVFWLSGQ